MESRRTPRFVGGRQLAPPGARHVVGGAREKSKSCHGISWLWLQQQGFLAMNPTEKE